MTDLPETQNTAAPAPKPLSPEEELLRRSKRLIILAIFWSSLIGPLGLPFFGWSFLKLIKDAKGQKTGRQFNINVWVSLAIMVFLSALFVGILYLLVLQILDIIDKIGTLRGRF